MAYQIAASFSRLCGSAMPLKKTGSHSAGKEQWNKSLPNYAAGAKPTAIVGHNNFTAPANVAHSS
jgi:hypothetical protein